jgi:hypothetical protein
MAKSAEFSTIRGTTPLLLSLLIAACRPAAPPFDETRARAHVEMLAGTIGSRPVGSPENGRAREYLVGQLKQLGFAVRVQQTDAVDFTQGITAPVSNIIAIKDGQRREAIALISHYDSVPEAMGAQDDAIGVTTCLEAARELLTQPLRHSLFVIITDGEELGLLGARVVVSDPDVADRVKAFLNFDGTGASGPALLFEAGPGRGTPLDAWARGAAAPEGASFTTEIYKRLPNNTDFTVFKALDTSGLNFAPVGDSYSYHTDRDVASRVQSATLRHEIANTITTVRAIDASEFTTDPKSPPTYFDMPGLGAIVYGPGIAAVIAFVGFVLGIAVWLRLTRDLWRARGIGGVVLTALWSAFAAVLSLGAMIVAVSVLRLVRSELTPWYASPQWFFLFVASAGAAGAWIAIRVSHVLPELGGPWRHPAAAWWAALPVWLGLAGLLQRSAPTAAYLVTVPLAVAGALLLAAAGHPNRVRGVSLVILAVAAHFGLGDTLRLLGFFVPLYAWLPGVAPVWLYPAVMAAAGLLVVPPLLAAREGLSSSFITTGRVGAVLALAVLVFGYQAYSATAYTAERPERRTARYVQDDVRGEAWWEVGGKEPGPDLAGAGPADARWMRVTDAPAASVRLSYLGEPIVFRTSSAIAGSVPADVRGVFVRDALNRAQVTVTIVPHENLVLRLVLPRDLMPAESTLAGQVGVGQWSAVYVSPPASGLAVKLTFNNWPSTQPPPIFVTFTTLGLPGGAGRLRLPSWLPQAKTTWRARSVYLTDVKY